MKQPNQMTKAELLALVEDLGATLESHQKEAEQRVAALMEHEQRIDKLEKESQPRPNETRKKSVVFFRNSFPESEASKNVWAYVVAQHSGLVIGRIAASTDGYPAFYLNPGAGCLSHQALLDISEYVGVHGLWLAS